jgi:hypothetical protein
LSPYSGQEDGATITINLGAGQARAAGWGDLVGNSNLVLTYQVTLTNTSTGASESIPVNASGQASKSGINPGTYTIAVSARVNGWNYATGSYGPFSLDAGELHTATINMNRLPGNSINSGIVLEGINHGQTLNLGSASGPTDLLIGFSEEIKIWNFSSNTSINFTVLQTLIHNFNIIPISSGPTSQDSYFHFTIEAQANPTPALEMDTNYTNTVTIMGGGFTLATFHVSFSVGNPTPHIVTFNAEGGGFVQSQTVLHGGLATNPGDPPSSPAFPLDSPGLFRGDTVADPAITHNSNFIQWNNPSGSEFNFTTPITTAITLHAVWEAPFEKIDGTVVPINDVGRAITYVNLNTTPAGTYTLLMNDNDTVGATQTLDAGSDLTIIGLEPVVIDLAAASGSMFAVIGTGATLSIGNNITLQGHASNSSSLVLVGTVGAFTMNNGSRVTGNGILSTNSSGVEVLAGTFNMNGGTINNNRSLIGGGVRVHSGTFDMSGGTISGNSAQGEGGGVWISDTGNFIKTGGTIYGGEAGSNANNVTSGNNGHAVFWARTTPLRRNTTLGTGAPLSTNPDHPNWDP